MCLNKRTFSLVVVDDPQDDVAEVEHQAGEDEGGDAVHSKVLHHELLRHGFKIPKLALLVARIVDHKVETELANQLFEL